jgi:hypothetical protein
MEKRASTFECLPSHAWEVLLLQAWQHLDQRHRFGVIPRVCSSWYHLSLPTFTTLKLALHKEEAGEQLGMWLVRHGSTLQHLSLDLGAFIDKIDRKGIQPGQALADGIRCCTSLCSLEINGWTSSSLVLDMEKMAQLTSLQLCNAFANCCNVQQFLQMPPQVRCLSFKGTNIHLNRNETHRLLTRLPNLTSLDLRRTSMHVQHVASCPRLPLLQDLKLGLELMQRDRMDSLARLPCTHLEVDFDDMDDVALFVRWGRGQQGKQCLGRLLSLDCFLYDDCAESRCAEVLLPFLATAATNLRHLGITGSTAGVEDLSLLRGLKQLTSLSFTYTGPDDADVVAPLAVLPNLQQLTVAWLYEEQLEAAEAAIEGGQLPCLKRLNVVSDWEDFGRGLPSW